MNLEVQSSTIRGLKTAWIQRGQANANEPHFLFLHGFPDSARSWNKQMEVFSEKTLTIAPFGRGVGPSELGSSSERFTFDAIALDLLKVLDYVQMNAQATWVVVGHDVGAAQAFHLGRLLGDRLHSLVLINGVSLDMMVRRMTNIKQLRKSWYIGMFQIPFVSEFLFEHFGGTALARSIGSAFESEFNAKESASVLRQYRYAVLDALKTIKNPPPKLQVPLLVLWGKNDAFLETPTLDELERVAVRPELRILEGGHWIHREQPERVNELIERFVREAKRAS